MNKQNLLSRAEMKKVMGGTRMVNEGGGGGCKADSEIGCSMNGAGNAEDQCCTGLICELNATGTGTICGEPR